MNNQSTTSSNNTPTSTKGSSIPTSLSRYGVTEATSFNINPIHLIIFLSIIAIIALIITTIVININKEPEIKINNFNTYYPSIPTSDRTSAQIMLYNIVNSNKTSNDMKIPKSGAIIRENSTEGSYDKDTNVYNDHFIVDIEPLQQSYYVNISWSPDKNNDNLLGGYPIYILCPTKEQLIYPAFECEDGFSNQQEVDLFAGLPIKVNYYTDNYANYVSYEVIGVSDKESKDGIKLIINDYTGGNHQAALTKLREADINPDEYIVEYNDLSSEQIPSHAPDDI